MATVNRNGATISSGSGKHADKRKRRRRTRKAAKEAALKEQLGLPAPPPVV